MRSGLLSAAAFAAGLSATALLTPVAGSLARRVGLVDLPGPTKYHRTPTPYLGGLAVAAGLAVAVAAGFALLEPPLAAGPVLQLGAILAGALLMAVLGLVDDRRGLGPSPKVAAQMVAALLLWAVGVRASISGLPAIDVILTLAWVVGVTNAVNLLDNMDALASGVTGIASLAYLAIALRQGDQLVAPFAAGLAGASGGFLVHNFPPARIFLGDAGSLPLGFLLAALGLKLDLMAEGPVRAAVAALIVAVPAFDTALVVLSRVREGRPWYRGNTDHSSHRLVRLGLAPRHVALWTFGAEAALAGAAVVLAEARPEAVVPAAIVVGLLLLLGLRWFLGIPWEGASRGGGEAGPRSGDVAAAADVRLAGPEEGSR